MHVGQHGQTGLAAHLVEDLEAGVHADPRLVVPDERLALSNEPLKMSGMPRFRRRFP